MGAQKTDCTVWLRGGSQQRLTGSLALSSLDDSLKILLCVQCADVRSSRSLRSRMVLCAGITFHVLTLVQNFYTPFIRDVLLQHGMADCAKQTCINILRKYASCPVAVCPTQRWLLRAFRGLSTLN